MQTFLHFSVCVIIVSIKDIFLEGFLGNVVTNLASIENSLFIRREETIFTSISIISRSSFSMEIHLVVTQQQIPPPFPLPVSLNYRGSYLKLIGGKGTY